MDETQENQQQESGGGVGKTIGIIILILLVIAVLAALFAKPTMLDQLKKGFSSTQKEVENVQEESTEAQEEVVGEVREGLEEIGEAISGINNPLVRLMLAKAYAVKLASVLSEQGKEDLNTVIVFVEKQPEILIQPTPAWPAEVKAALTRLQTEITKAKVKAVAVSMASAIADAKSKVGDQVVLTGTWELVQSMEEGSPVGSMFSLTDSAEGEMYYFLMSGQAEEDAMELVGTEVTVTIKITSDENGYVTYDVVSGPKAVETVTPTATVEE